MVVVRVEVGVRRGIWMQVVGRRMGRIDARIWRLLFVSICFVDGGAFYSRDTPEVIA